MAEKIIDRQLFRVREFPAARSTKVVFVFTAMGTKMGLYRVFVRGLLKKGYAVVIYDYPLSVVLNPVVDSWNVFVGAVVTYAQERLVAHERAGAKAFCAYGVSMGTLIANKFTRETEQVEHVILNLTYGDVADNIWTYRGVRKAKEKWLRLGIDREDLRQMVTGFDPVVTAPGLKGKKVLLHLSRPDKVLVYEQTKYTKEAFEANIDDLRYVENKYLGHYLGAVKNMLSLSKIDKFYRS